MRHCIGDKQLLYVKDKGAIRAQQFFIKYWLTGNEPLPEILMIYILFYAHICRYRKSHTSVNNEKKLYDLTLFYFGIYCCIFKY